MAAKYKILKDIAIADIAFEIVGKDQNELFENSALALFEQTADIKSIKGEVKREFEITSETLETLLFDFLSELLYLKDAEQLIGKSSTIKIKKSGKGFTLNALIIGDKVNQKRHILKSDIKAITYHLFQLRKEANRMIARVVVDI